MKNNSKMHIGYYVLLLPCPLLCWKAVSITTLQISLSIEDIDKLGYFETVL